MATPRQMTAHCLEHLKGVTPGVNYVDFRAKLSANVTIDPVYKGRVVHLNSEGEYEMGVGTQAVMPLFLLSNSDDPDVRRTGGDPATEKGIWRAGIPTGAMSALVAIGGFELLSTEFVAGSYPPNTHLTAAASNSNASTGGVLTSGTLGTDTICGVVSRGVMAHKVGIANPDALAFWPVYIPPQ